MRKIILTGAIASVLIGSLFPYNAQPPSELQIQTSITGKISPADGAEVVWIISATDSVKAGVVAGSFAVQVKPGMYKLIVDAKDPYKDIQLDNLEVKQNQTFDVGEIILQK